MGRVLQVRVSAFTYSEDDVRKAWPVLWRWAFEETKPGFPHEMKGVLELVRALEDLYRFGDIPSALREVLEKDLPRAVRGVEALEQELGNWNARGANTATDAIEDSLTELEKHAPKP
ncbi:MAG: formin-like protein 18 [Deltaproteobacteria bacterium]|nr:formin-like protein 18 [Deltaproteobacteria bacterium]